MTPAADRRAVRLDRKTAPVRAAVLQWAHEHGHGFSAGYYDAEAEWRINVHLRDLPDRLLVTIAETGATVRVKCGEREVVLAAPTPRTVTNAMGRVGGAA